MIGDLTRTQIEHLLQTAIVGRLGCSDGSRAYVVPITFAYEDGFIYGHSGIGMKVEMMRANPQVCFEVDIVDSLADWRSAILFGTYEELEDDARDAGLELLVQRLVPFTAGETSHPHGVDGPDVGSTQHFMDRSARHGVVFRIRIKEMTGRFEKR